MKTKSTCRWMPRGRAAVVAAMILTIGCEAPLGKAGRECDEGQVRAGTRCITTGVQPSLPDSAIAPVDGGLVEQDASVPTVTLPFTVDDSFYPSGYMGDGETGGIAQQPCASRAESAVGSCHGFIWTPGELGWAGVFWQHPDGNWGDTPGFEMPTGARSVRFHAWGQVGGESVTFGVGIADVDGFERSLDNVQLTAEPVAYAIDLRESNYGAVVGAFSWTMSGSETPQTIFIDNLHWSTDPVMDVEPPEPMEPGLPLQVDAWFAPSGYMGDGSAGGISASPCASDSAGGSGVCHQFVWTPLEQGWAGVFWQYPDGNWGEQPGLQIPPGAQSIRFEAWGDQGGETVTFGAGYGANSADGFGIERTITLDEEPMPYSIDLSQTTYETVAGGFVWTAANADSPLTFYIRGIEWSTEPAEAHEEEPQISPLPMTVSEHFIPAGYIGAAADIAPTECPADAMMNDCAGFAWSPSPDGAGWGGVIWQHPNGNWGREPGLMLAPGATRLSFFAWADEPTASVSFGAGYGANSTDGFDVELTTPQLSSTPTLFEIDLATTQYTTVASGFRWTTDSAEPFTLYISDVVWSD